MDMRIFYIIFFTIAKASAQTQCETILMRCAYTITCTDIVYINLNWDSFTYYPGPPTFDQGCHQFVSYNGRNLYPITLVFKQTDASESPLSVPSISQNWNMQEIPNIIHTLDLSGNSYHETPSIRSMFNLAVLNISRNELTTAALYNSHELSMLTQLDLSHNMISDITVNNDEQPYNKLTVLDLSHNYLVNVPDAIFDSFDNLETLDLSYNYIDILSQFTFEGIKKLINLNLSNNRLTDINSSLFRFSELQILNLKANKIKVIKINDFKHLVKLKVLDLSSNNIKNIDVYVFQTMISLESLYLSHNLLEVVEANTFSNLQSLDTIDLANNKIKTLPLYLFKNTEILTFFVNENRLEGTLEKGMFEGVNVTRLDLSNQFLTEVKDYAFYNLLRLDTLILESNRLQFLRNMCFKTLVNLQILDLSDNQITHIDFDKADLGNLQSLILKNNRLIEIKLEELQHLTSLGFLDISVNMITHLEPNSFKNLRNLINLQIHSNPLEGILETATFEGLVLLPHLDISHSMLTTITNASFSDMTALMNLDISYCKISELQYNAFIYTGYIETLDLSFNKLKDFNINTTELVGLRILFLHNNLIKNISPLSLGGLSGLNNITLSHNAIVSIDSESFGTLVDLRYLDISYNQKYNMTGLTLEKSKDLNTLVLSGIETKINFAHFLQDNQITDLVISNGSITDISDLYLRRIPHVDTLNLSSNNISKLQVGDFTELNVLRHLDLSFNKISFIQPATFKNNTLLISLNISHNNLLSISYGIFHGLLYLNTLDISYNNVEDLGGERFYELTFLTELIVDHNKLHSIKAEDFLGTTLRRLSIGDNPLSCDILVKMKRDLVPFVITAIRIDEHMYENVNGVVCNKRHMTETTISPKKNRDNTDILNRLQDIFSNLSKDNDEKNNKDVQYLEKISNLLEKSTSIYSEKLTNLIDLTSNVRSINNKTNIMFNEIIKLLDKIRSGTVSTSPVPAAHIVTPTSTRKPILSNDSNSNPSIDVVSYINKIKKELENTIASERQNIIMEFKNKYDSNHQNTESLPTANIGHEKLVSSNSEMSKSLFTETCVALILLILVGLVLYKFYKSRMFVRNRFSISTRELPGAMENSNL